MTPDKIKYMDRIDLVGILGLAWRHPSNQLGESDSPTPAARTVLQIDPKDTRVVLAFIAVVFVAPVALISYGRHQGWQMHQDCLQGALSLQGDATAQELLEQCRSMP